MKNCCMQVQGRAHIKNDVPCQDKTYTLTDPSGASIALADGAGSAGMSHFGAEPVTKCITEYLTEHFEEFCSLAVMVDEEKIIEITDREDVRNDE